MDVVNVTLTGVSDQQSSVIHCMSEFSVRVMNAQNVTISKLNFFSCGAAIVKKLTAIKYNLSSVVSPLPRVV